VTPKTVKVLIADDHRLMLAGVRRALDSSEGIEVVDEVSSGTQVLPAVARTSPDVLLLDIRMPGMSGLECLERVRGRYPDVRVIMLSAHGDAEHVATARAKGASAYVVKSVDPVDLPAVIRSVVDGAEFAEYGRKTSTEEGANSAGLSARELTILEALGRGLSNLEIAKELWVSEQTVKFHLRNIYRKLDIASRTEAVRYAYQHGLVTSQR
jgi:DNA-binding NarL/FixJ family response regulator